jgi:hypothetical protein
LNKDEARENSGISEMKTKRGRTEEDEGRKQGNGK